MSTRKVDEAPRSARASAQALYLVSDDAPPPSRSPASRRLGIPAYPDELVGRSGELAALERLVSGGSRLLTVRGPGGMGKTRLVAAWAGRAARAGHDVAFVPLAPLTQSENVAAAVAVALGLTVDPETDPGDDVLRALRDRGTILVLDNLEHLLTDGRLRRWLQAILDRSPRVRIVGTSRERLGLTAEHVVELAGLAVGDSGETSEAFTLFEKRARQVQSTFDAESQRAAIVAICGLLEGVPLAIELAATWVRMLSGDEILAEITKTLDFLTADPRSGRDARQSSMRAVFAQSWRLLRDDEQRALARLSIFRGGFDRAGAERVARASLPLLAALLDRSLVRAHSEGGPTRYTMHELLRQFAAEQLGDDGAAVGLAHAEHFTDVAQALHPHLRGARQVETLAQLTHDLDNLRAALDFAMKGERYDLVARIGWALWPFWWIRNMQREGRRWLEALMPHAGTLDLFWRTQATIAVGAMVYAQGDVEACVRYSHVLVELAAAAGGDPRPLAFAHGGFGLGATAKGDFAGAIEHLTKARALFVQAGDPGIAAQAAAWVATVNLFAGNLDAAKASATAALNESLASGDRLSSVSARYCLARIAIARDALEEATDHLLASIAPSLAIEDRGSLSYIFELLGVLCARCEAFACGATMFGASDAIVEAIVHRGHTYYLPDTRSVEKARGLTRERLGRDGFDHAYAEGKEASVEALEAIARGIPLGAAPREPAPSTPAAPSDRGALRLRFFEEDDSVFLEHEYLIKGVAGRLLWRMLHLHQTEGRSEFTNRELRLDPWLKLPSIRDNLESRLVLLEKRLTEKAPPFRIERAGRGRLRLVVDSALALEITPASE